MIDGRSGLSFSLKSRQALRLFGKIVGQKFESDETVKASVFGPVDHTHATTAKLLDDAVM